MPNVTNKSLREAGVPEALWDRAKKICNSPPYKVARHPHQASGGPFALPAGMRPRLLMLEGAKTAPILVGKWYGFYERVTDAFFSKGYWLPGIVKWRDLP
jgi:hypothetical protein